MQACGARTATSLRVGEAASELLDRLSASALMPERRRRMRWPRSIRPLAHACLLLASLWPSLGPAAAATGAAEVRSRNVGLRKSVGRSLPTGATTVASSVRTTVAGGSTAALALPLSRDDDGRASSSTWASALVESCLTRKVPSWSAGTAYTEDASLRPLLPRMLLLRPVPTRPLVPTPWLLERRKMRRVCRALPYAPPAASFSSPPSSLDGRRVEKTLPVASSSASSITSSGELPPRPEAKMSYGWTAE